MESNNELRGSQASFNIAALILFSEFWNKWIIILLEQNCFSQIQYNMFPLLVRVRAANIEHERIILAEWFFRVRAKNKVRRPAVRVAEQSWAPSHQRRNRAAQRQRK